MEVEVVTPLSLSVVIPCFNEARAIGRTLESVAAARARGAEIIVVDGGSSDETASVARGGADRVIVAPRGRSCQMNDGAAVAAGEILLFLHADTRPPLDFDISIADGVRLSGLDWGRFDVRIEGRHRLLPVVSRMMNVRSRITGIATGDQGLFVRRAFFAEVGGFPNIALMEDVELSRTLRSRGRPLCLRARVTTSGRRWDDRGFLSTVVLMWQLRFAYWRGVDPRELAQRYGH